MMAKFSLALQCECGNCTYAADQPNRHNRVCPKCGLPWDGAAQTIARSIVGFHGSIESWEIVEDVEAKLAALQAEDKKAEPGHHGMRRVRLQGDADLEAWLHPEFGMTEGRVMVEFDDGQCILFAVSEVKFLDPYAPEPAKDQGKES